MRHILLVIGLMTFSQGMALAASAESRNRQPWEWTLEERIRDRADPAKAAQRVAARNADISGIRVRATETGESLRGDAINGHRNPELFLPIELFQIFVSGAFTEDPKGRAVYRQARTETSTVPLPQSFWTKLEEITNPYVITLNRGRALNQRAGQAQGEEKERLQRESQAIQAGQCERLAKELDAVRQEFGTEFFDRFLYESVAPGSGIGLSRPNTPAELIWMARGCR